MCVCVFSLVSCPVEASPHLCLPQQSLASPLSCFIINCIPSSPQLLSTSRLHLPYCYTSPSPSRLLVPTNLPSLNDLLHTSAELATHHVYDPHSRISLPSMGERMDCGFLLCHHGIIIILLLPAISSSSLSSSSPASPPIAQDFFAGQTQEPFHIPFLPPQKPTPSRIFPEKPSLPLPLTDKPAVVPPCPHAERNPRYVLGIHCRALPPPTESPIP